MADFWMALSDMVIKSHFKVFNVEAKKKIYTARCETHGCPWKDWASLSSGWMRVTLVGSKHVGSLGDHTMETAEQIAAKLEGLFDNTQHITRKEDDAMCAQVVGHGVQLQKVLLR